MATYDSVSRNVPLLEVRGLHLFNGLSLPVILRVCPLGLGPERPPRLAA